MLSVNRLFTCFSGLAGGNYEPSEEKIASLTQLANQHTLDVTQSGVRKAIRANARLAHAISKVIKLKENYSVPCLYEELINRNTLSLSRALILNNKSLRLKEVVKYSRALLSNSHSEQRFFALDSVLVPRSDVEEMSRGRIPMTAVERLEWNKGQSAMQEAWQFAMEGGWNANPHLGGFLHRGAEVLRILRQQKCAQPLFFKTTYKKIAKFLEHDRQAHEGLLFAMNQNRAVNEGALNTNSIEVISLIWTYCETLSDESLKQNLKQSFVRRLKEVRLESTCSTGCVQRLLQFAEGIDPSFSSNVPNVSDLQEEIVSMVAQLDAYLDEQIENDEKVRSQVHFRSDEDSQSSSPASSAIQATESIILYKQQSAAAAIDRSLIDQRQLPLALVHQAMAKPLNFIELNELSKVGLVLADLSIGYRDYQGMTILMRAVQSGDLNLVNQQIAKGADVNALFNTETKESLLMVATTKGYFSIVESLLQVSDINVNYQLESGETALFLAVKESNTAMIDLLLTSPKVDVNHVDKHQTSALFIAIRKGDVGSVMALLKSAQLNIHYRQTCGLNALDMARVNGQNEILAILRTVIFSQQTKQFQ